MIRGLMNFLVFNAFVLLLPVACFAAWGWGSADERWLMKVAICVLGPFCLDFWYLHMDGKRVDQDLAGSAVYFNR